MASDATRHVTIADVARAAGVNSSTVSRVLNRRVSVKAETRRRIEEAVTTLGYSPSQAARSLASARTWTLGVLLPDIRNLVHADFLRGAEAVVQEFGYSLLIADGQLSPAIQAATLDRFLKMRVDGLIVSRAFALPALLEPFARAGVPVEPREVYAGLRARLPKDHRLGSYDAFRHLFALGHRTVAVFVHERPDAPKRSGEMRARIGALMSVRDEVGAAEVTVHIAGVNHEEECAAALAGLMAGNAPPTALIAGNDWMTAPLLAAVRDAGLAIPKDISFLTYADSRWAAAYRPAISVIRYDYAGEGRTLASRLLRHLGEKADEDTADRPLAREEFVDRKSLGRPRALTPGELRPATPSPAARARGMDG